MSDQSVNAGVPPDLLTDIVHCILAAEDAQAREAAVAFLSDVSLDWERFLTVVQRNRVGAILFHSAVQAGLPIGSAAGALRNASLTNIWRNSIFLNELKNLLKQFQAVYTPVTILKGAALLFTVYSNVGLRQMSDFDLLVRVQDVDQASRLILAEGYTRYDSTPALPVEYLREITFSKKINSFPVFIDLHGSITSPPHHLGRQQKEWFWQNSIDVEKDGLRVRVLKPEAQLLHLCWHLVHHHGGDLQAQYDIHELIRLYAHTLDWTEVLQVGKAFNLLIPLQQVLSQLSLVWKTPVPIEVLGSLAELQPSRREQRIYAEPYGRESRQYFSHLWLELTGYDNWRERIGYFWHRLFPAPEFMKENYGTHTRWPLPFFYLYRWWVLLMRKNQKSL